MMGCEYTVFFPYSFSHDKDVSMLLVIYTIRVVSVYVTAIRDEYNVLILLTSR